MVKKNALLFVVLAIGSSCFGMQKPPKKNQANQNFFTSTALYFLNFFANRKPKQLELPTPIHKESKEFVCKEQIKTNDPKFSKKTKTDAEIDAEVRKEFDDAWAEATSKYKNKK